MKEDGITPNVINYNLAVRALGKGGDWERATGLLEEMKKSGVDPDDRTFNAAIEARQPASVICFAYDLFFQRLRRIVDTPELVPVHLVTGKRFAGLDDTSWLRRGVFCWRPS